MEQAGDRTYTAYTNGYKSKQNRTNKQLRTGKKVRYRGQEKVFEHKQLIIEKTRGQNASSVKTRTLSVSLTMVTPASRMVPGTKFALNIY